MPAKECPLCGEPMRIRQREMTQAIPGTPQTNTQQFGEWVCPECEYFEDVDEDWDG